jgi:hypothetical protein
LALASLLVSVVCGDSNMGDETETPRPWLKLIPAIISGIVSVFILVATLYQVLIGTALYLGLYCITWRKADGTRVFPPYLW